MRRRKGFLLITTLLVLVVMFVLGMGLMSSQAARCRAALRMSDAVLARQIALAGLEDARVKLNLDICFPPPPAGGFTSAAYSSGSFDNVTQQQTQPLFTYSETIDIPSTPPRKGVYAVTVDSTHAIPNFWDSDHAAYDTTWPTMVIRIVSVGTIIDEAQPLQTRVISQYQMTGEVDISQGKRTGPGTNPRYFRYTHIEDQQVP